MSDTIIILFIIVGILYCINILLYTIAWFKIEKIISEEKIFSTKISVIISARNEGGNIENCLNDICNQSYPKELTEIIIIDDASSDQTFSLVENFIKNNDNNIHLLQNSDNDAASKKEAIKKGVNYANGSLIVTSDADCRYNSNWLKNIAEYFEKHSPEMIVAPVAFHNCKNIFTKLQSLEFISLITSSAAAVQLKAPIMCNGANLAYTKKAFNEVKAYDKDIKFLSGDDVFLMLKIKKRFGAGSIQFIKSYDAIVKTEAKVTMKAFIRQRIRWVSKSRAYNDFSVILTAMIVYAFNFSLLISLISGFFIWKFMIFFLLAIGVKIIIDMPLMISALRFTKQIRYFLLYFPLQFLYIFYISIIGMAGNFINAIWKDRKVVKKQNKKQFIND